MLKPLNFLARLKRMRSAEDADARLIHAYRQVFMGTEEGKLVLDDLLYHCGLFNATAPGPDVHEGEPWFRHGQLDVALHVLHQLEVRDIDKLG